MKKSLSIILSLAMVCTMSATAFAADSSTDLSAIADATIQVTQTTSESGAITNTFNNLDDFVNAVHTANPAISDYEIATYILDYTGQEYQDLPEEEILSFLTYDNISTSSSYVRVDDEGNTIVSNFDAIPLADWTSDDGYMKITTNYSYIKTVGREKYYSVWARGTWQEYPAIQAGYAHKTIGFGDISVGIDVNGTPSFSASVATVVPYVARAVTVTY